MRKVICKKCLREGEETEETFFLHVCLPERTIADLTRARDALTAEVAAHHALMTRMASNCDAEVRRAAVERESAEAEVARLKAWKSAMMHSACEGYMLMGDDGIPKYTPACAANKQAREAAESRLRELREAVDAAINENPQRMPTELLVRLQAAIAKSAEP